MITIENVRQAQERIAAHVPVSPLLEIPSLSTTFGRRVFFKLENTLPTGSFKVRPAFNGMLARLEEAKARGVLASSSGNFAQAVAHAAHELGVSACIVMTSGASPHKVERTRRLGAEVVVCGNSFEERWDTTHRIERDSGRVLLHPYDSPETIAGDGTVGLELLDQLEGDFEVAVPSSGGGLVAGISLALASLRPTCRVIAVQPSQNGALARSLASTAPVNVGPVSTVADALVASAPGARALELIRVHAPSVAEVSDEEIVAAVKTLAADLKLIAEPGGAVAVAALLAGKLGNERRDLVCVVSGGNISLSALARLVSE